MDNSTLLGIIGIAVTIFLAIIGFFVGNKTIGSIHAKLDMHDKLIALVHDAQKDMKEITMTSLQKGDKINRDIQTQTKVPPKEEEEIEEALREMRQKLYHSAPVLSNRKKVRG